MNRVEIKEEAKNKLRGNLWNLWKPILVVYIITFAIEYISGLFGETILGFVVALVAGFATAPLSIGLLHYNLNFVRGLKFEVNDLYKYYKNIWVIIGVSLLTTLIIMGGTLLFVVPGVIFSYMYIMCNYVLADGENSVMSTLRKSKEMMNGYKMDYFVFMLSFIGWILLVIITFGIAVIYVGPYMSVAQAIYYDRLKQINGK